MVSSQNRGCGLTFAQIPKYSLKYTYDPHGSCVYYEKWGKNTAHISHEGQKSSKHQEHQEHQRNPTNQKSDAKIKHSTKNTPSHKYYKS